MSEDSRPADALSSGPMPVEFAMLPSRDDGSPLPIFYMSPRGGTARLRLISGLPAPIENTDEAQGRATSLIQSARSLAHEDRAAAMPAFNKGIFAARDRWGVFAPDEETPPMLDVLRLQWRRNSSPPFLIVSGWARAENGARMSAWTERHELTHADDTRRRLWTDYRLNLGAIRAFLDLTQPFGNKLKQPEGWASLVRHDHVAAFNDGDIITGDVGYYDYEAVELLKDRVVKDARRQFPWHRGPHGEEISIGLRFSAPGQPETAHVLLFEEGDPVARYEAPLVDERETLKTKRALAFRLLNEIRRAEELISEQSIEYRRLISSDPARAAQLNSRLDETENTLLRKREEFAHTYASIIEFVAPKREILLEKARKHEQAKAKLDEKRARVEAIKDNYTPVSKISSTLAEHLTVVPVAFSVQTLGHKAQLSQTLTSPTGQQLYSRNLELFEQVDKVPEGLPSLADAASRVFGSDLVWLPLLSYVGLSMDVRTKTEIPGLHYISAGDLFRRIRPNASAKIAKNGLADWWKTTHSNLDMSPTDALEASLRFLSGVVVPYREGDIEKRLIGLLNIQEVQKNGRGQISYGYAWNLALRSLITGDEKEGRDPSYMLVNHRALFSYSGKSLQTAPAMQVLLESMAHAAAMGGGRNAETEAGALEIGLTPGGDHMRFGHLVEKLHLHGERPNHIAKRVEGTLDALQEAGVIDKFHIFGASSNVFEKKIRIVMSPDYLEAPALARAMREERRLRRELETQPFEPTQIERAMKARRGRPPKKKP